MELPYPMRDNSNSKKFAEYVDYVSGRRLPAWTLSDLTLPPIRRRQSGGWFDEEDKEESADIAPEYRQLPAFHPLCPDRQTLDKYLVRLIGFLSSRYHTAGAVLEAVPAWLRFLQKYELIDGDQAGEALASLKKLAADWENAVETATDDPLLRENAVKLYERW